MSAVADPAPPFVLHDPKHINPEEDHPRRAALTSVPDLRFEYGFLKSVRPYFRLSKGKERETATPGDVLEIQWKDVAWVTTRDQVLSPLAQGALWCVIAFFTLAVALIHVGLLRATG
ncbi:hypothetical protein FB45DRAFT_754312 [Roridomyces roridus]|uniref:Uncharacterized protein n=1 Tax=Roridomyces roridus TaxID=1738132 RepID=A0AAD7FFL6_9AGAR|nr:hypothetical protein FB45DRAFT_754312 [Roridomyces roridus]